MSKFWSKIVSQLDPYVPGEQPKGSGQIIKLNTNENPYGPSPKAIAAMQATINDELRLYPDPSATELKQAIADHYGVEFNQVFVGNGSDEVLAHTFQGLLNQNQPLRFPDITYSFYPVYCGLYGMSYKRVPLTDDFKIDPADYRSKNGGAIILPNPNAPTGVGLGREAIRQLLEENPDSVVAIDEAYIDFGGESAVSLVNSFKNLLVIQTFSKSRSLAGLRVGFAIGDSVLIEALERVKNSFNSYPLDRIAINGAVASIRDESYFVDCCKKIIHTREHLTQKLNSLGFDVLPSQANFVFAKPTGIRAVDVYQELRKKEIIVRYFDQPRIDERLRITVGTTQECDTLVDALHGILG